jgi:hypothetical protein
MLEAKVKLEVVAPTLEGAGVPDTTGSAAAVAAGTVRVTINRIEASNDAIRPLDAGRRVFKMCAPLTQIG